MNQILKARTGPFESLNFQAFQDKDFKPSILDALEKGKEEIQKIKDLPASFENTIMGLERATEDLEFTYGVFGNLNHADSNEVRQGLAMEMAPLLSQFSDDLLLDDGVFSKVKEVFENKDQLSLDS
ncbi:MAG TPA: peptidase M3, partial [Bdellovibrionales bacterium]|nr:peptidase M3 [Bdellovibrionales bacterium]